MAPIYENELERLLRWRAGDMPGPLEVMFFPTNRCNQHCQICWQRRAEKEERGVDLGELPDERLLELVDEAAALDARYGYIVGGGEPLVRAPLVMRMCERFRHHGLYGTLHTNGTMFTPEHLERLVKIGWNRLVISLDGPTQEINDAIRSKNSFERATRNLQKLAELRKKHGAEVPVVSINMVVTNTNFDKLDQMVQLAQDLDCRGGIQAAMLLPLSAECEAFALSPEQWAILPEHIARAAALAEKYGLTQNFESVLPGTKQKSCRPAAEGMPRFSGSQCFEGWLALTITADGHVGPCCMSWDENSPLVQEHSLEEIWRGPYLEDIRRRLMFRKALPPYCKDCPTQLIDRAEGLRGQLEASPPPPEASFWQLIRRFGGQLRRGGVQAALQRTARWIKMRRHH